MSKATDEKIDELAQTTAKSFQQIQVTMATKDDLEDLATKDDIKNMATQDDLGSLKHDIDVMLDRHIGTFRKDYDELAQRVLGARWVF